MFHILRWNLIRHFLYMILRNYFRLLHCKTCQSFYPRYTPNCLGFRVRDEYLINLIPFLWGVGLWCVLISFSKPFSHQAGYKIYKISSFYHPFISFSGCFIYHLLFRFNIEGFLNKSHPISEAQVCDVTPFCKLFSRDAETKYKISSYSFFGLIQISSTSLLIA